METKDPGEAATSRGVTNPRVSEVDMAQDTGRPCSFDGCPNLIRYPSSELCASHYHQKRKTGELRPLKFTWADKDSPCIVCGEAVPKGSRRRRHCSPGCQMVSSRYKSGRPVDALCGFCGKSFDLRIRTPGGRLQRTDTIWCPDCGRESPDVQRFRNYGITREQYESALAAGCVICTAVDVKLHVDHDHACCPGKRSCGDCVRGLICGPCNRGLGLFKDDPASLIRAAAYLTERSAM